MFLASPATMLAGAVFSALLLAAAHVDMTARRIPNALVLALAITGASAAATVMGVVGLRDAAAGFAVGLAMWVPLWLVGVLGAGDVKLAAAIGIWLGPIGVVEASALAALAGGVLALAVLARRRRLGALTGGIALWVATLRQGRVTRPLVGDKAEVLPYGVALATGAALAGWLPTTWIAF